MLDAIGGLADPSLQPLRLLGRQRTDGPRSFEDFDLDGNSRVSREEFSEVLTGTREAAAPGTRIGELYDRMDADGDSALTRDELSAFRERRDRMMNELSARSDDILARAFGSETALALRSAGL